MSNTVTRDEAEQYSYLREKSPESLYRSGTRRKVPRGEPTERNLLIAQLATELTQKLTNAGLAILGESGLLRVAESLVEELDQETNLIRAVENVDGSDRPPERSGNHVLGHFQDTQIRAAIATDLAKRTTSESRKPEQVLEDVIGDARLLQSEFASNRSSPQSVGTHPNEISVTPWDDDSDEIEGKPMKA